MYLDFDNRGWERISNNFYAIKLPGPTRASAAVDHRVQSMRIKVRSKWERSLSTLLRLRLPGANGGNVRNLALAVAQVYDRLPFHLRRSRSRPRCPLRRDLIDPTIAVHKGRIVKRTGDGSIVKFRSVVDAVRCDAGVPPQRQIVFRIGIHLGDVVEESDGDLMGDGVNIATGSSKSLALACARESSRVGPSDRSATKAWRPLGLIARRPPCSSYSMRFIDHPRVRMEASAPRTHGSASRILHGLPQCASGPREKVGSFA
jgi:hypothetical protein